MSYSGASNNFTILEHNILRHKDNCPVNQSDPGSGISMEIQNVVKDCLGTGYKTIDTGLLRFHGDCDFASHMYQDMHSSPKYVAINHA